MNKAIILGRLTKDPEVKSTPNGNSVAQFTVAVDRKYKNADGSKTTDFISCVAWRQVADIIGRYFHKGNRILITGEIQTRTYDDQQGVKHYVTEVIANEVDFIESANSQQNTPPPPPPTAPAATIEPNSYVAATEPNEEVDLPFEV